MNLSICITTRNRTPILKQCLEALWNSSVKPYQIVVSDDSSDPSTQQNNENLVQQYSNTRYLIGPRIGVCANRNHALRDVLRSSADLIAFIDDDICVDTRFFEQALLYYQAMSDAQRSRTILSGIHQQDKEISTPTKLSFRGYFCPSQIAESVNIHAAVFPRSLLEVEQWDENIFFGYEDAELCLRALKRGYQIQHCPELIVTDSCANAGTLCEKAVRGLTEYELYIEAARLYVGTKRYKTLFPNPIKLVTFLSVYFAHIVLYLAKRRSLQALPEIVRRSHIQKLWQPPQFSQI